MPAHLYERTRGVKWDAKEQEFLMWCPSCASKQNAQTFWPLSPEFWPVGHGLAMCRACFLEKKRRQEKGRRAEKRDQILAYNRAYYDENRELLRWKDNQRKRERNARRSEVSSEGAQVPVPADDNAAAR